MKKIVVTVTQLSMLAALGASAQTFNLPLGGRTTLQSSVVHGGGPARAIDGNSSTSWSSNSCTHTARENFPFFSVALPYNGTVPVYSVTITNRIGACNNLGLHPTIDVCNPGTFQGKRWHCAANTNLLANGTNSCWSGWVECRPGCNPGLFQGRTWRCPEHPLQPTGQGCGNGWRTCDASQCSERLDSVEVWVGDFVRDPNLPQRDSAGQIVGQSQLIRDYLDGRLEETAERRHPRQCNFGRPVYLNAGQSSVKVDCHGHRGAFIYIAKRRNDSVLTMCEVSVQASN